MSPSDTRQKPVGIFCLEGEWDTSMADRATVEHVLRMLEGLRIARVIHRDVGTRQEFEYYCKRWAQKGYADYRIGYFAFHGRPGCIDISSKETATLEQFANLLGNKIAGRVVYMGSCGTLAAEPDELKHFCAATEAKGIAGYTKSVNWVESAAFDLITLTALQSAKTMQPMFKRLQKRYPDLVDTLGFRVATSMWVGGEQTVVEDALATPPSK
ncbi:MAG TPA: DUF6642 family protein [Mycobacteriales bacterium]|nr:DUF6642 family protein [Mycobacteriales bacterium]